MVVCACALVAAARARPAIHTTFISRSPSRNGTDRIGSAHGNCNQIQDMAHAMRYRLWFTVRAATSARPRPGKETGAARAPVHADGARLCRVVHLEFDRVRGHAEALHLLVLQPDVGVEHVVGEYPAARQEIAVLVERLERFLERGARMRYFRRLLGLEVVEVLVER